MRLDWNVKEAVLNLYVWHYFELRGSYLGTKRRRARVRLPSKRSRIATKHSLAKRELRGAQVDTRPRRADHELKRPIALSGTDQSGDNLFGFDGDGIWQSDDASSPLYWRSRRDSPLDVLSSKLAMRLSAPVTQFASLATILASNPTSNPHEAGWRPLRIGVHRSDGKAKWARRTTAIRRLHGGVCGTISILSLHIRWHAGGPENPATFVPFSAKQR